MKKPDAYDKAEMKAIRLEYLKGIILGGLFGLLMIHLVILVYGMVWIAVMVFEEADYVGWGIIYTLPYIGIIGVLTTPFGYGLYKVMDKMGFSLEAVTSSVYAFYTVVILRVVLSIILQYT
jgi:hypothetical protein